MKKKDQISGVFWLFTAVITVQQSLELKIGTFRSPGPGYIPLLVGIGLAAVSLLIFLRATLLLPGNQPLGLGVPQGGLRKILFVLTGLFLFAFLFPLLGFMTSTFLLLFILLRGVEPQRWSTVILWSGGITFFAYILFVIILRSELPGGWLGF